MLNLRELHFLMALSDGRVSVSFSDQLDALDLKQYILRQLTIPLELRYTCHPPLNRCF